MRPQIVESGRGEAGEMDVRRSSRKTIGRWNWACIALLVCCGQSAFSDEPSPARPSPLRIAAASDLQKALPVLAARFTEKTKVPVSLTFGASGQLAEQVKAGAPFDVLLAANLAFVKELAAGGFVRPDSVKPYARGSLVVAVRRESEGSVKSLGDLARADVKKIALANPTFAPYGAAGKQALERAGLWDKVSSKIVRSDSVRQALQFVESGNADAGLVASSIAKGANVRIVEVDPRLYDPIIQGLGIVARTRQVDAADAFSRFVLGDDGQAILVEHGFSRPRAAAAAPGR